MFDVVIIGGGISGCSLLYELSRYKVKTLLLEQENDVGVGTTKANSAIVHAGYDPKSGTDMARYNVEGNRIIQQMCRDLDILYKNTGSLVLGFTLEDEETIEKLYQQGIENGVPDLCIWGKEELQTKEPAVNPDAIVALYAPTAGVVNPWELASAQAECAIEGGAHIQLKTKVISIEKKEDRFILKTSQGEIEARFVVNAAGVDADTVCSMVEQTNFVIKPNKGEYYLLDTTQGNLVRRVIFQCPTKEGKGVLVAPTVHGNLLVGPNAEDTQKYDVGNTAQGLAFVRKSAIKSVPTIEFRESIRNFAGVRAVSNWDDFIIEESKEIKGFFTIGGIKSPGLTAAPAIAKDMVKTLVHAGLVQEFNPAFVKKRKIFRFKYANNAERSKAIQENPLYGVIVCRCETITEGEIVDALHRPLAPSSLDGIKRRCSAGMGRCQGGFCGPRVQAIIARELGINEQDVPLDREGTQIIQGRTKTKKQGGQTK